MNRHLHGVVPRSQAWKRSASDDEMFGLGWRTVPSKISKKSRTRDRFRAWDDESQPAQQILTPQSARELEHLARWTVGVAGCYFYRYPYVKKSPEDSPANVMSPEARASGCLANHPPSLFSVLSSRDRHAQVPTYPDLVNEHLLASLPSIIYERDTTVAPTVRSLFLPSARHHAVGSLLHTASL